MNDKDECEHEYVLTDKGFICKKCKKPARYDYRYKKWSVE